MNINHRRFTALRHSFLGFCALAALGACASSAQEQASSATPPAGPGMSPELVAEVRAAEARNAAMPDTPGTGPYPALKEEDPSLPQHVVYRPTDLSAVPLGGLGIVAWGNGGCSDDGASARQHLAQLASHGYLVIASGTIKSGPGVAQRPPMPPPQIGPDGQRILPPPATSPSQMVEAIDWAMSQNADPASPYYRKLDPAAVAASGWSCGGLQALTVGASDPRVKTLVIHNSGVFNAPVPGRGDQPGKEVLAKLPGPTLYVLGGPEDIAYANGMDDFDRISGVPVAVLDAPVGHGGTFYQPNGGAAALHAVEWLNWQLKGDAEARARFLGEDCGLCAAAPNGA